MSTPDDDTPPDGDAPSTAEMPELELEDFELEQLSSDAELEAMERTTPGRPRTPHRSQAVYVRLMPRLDHQNLTTQLGGRNAKAADAAGRLLVALNAPLWLRGPRSRDQIDSLAATVFAAAPNFAAAIQAIRTSAQLSIDRGARWLQFKPILIEAPPGAGKTSFAMALAATAGLPSLYLDCAAMTTVTPIISADSLWSQARVAEPVALLARERVANPIIILDEVDKLKNLSQHAHPDATESLLPLLERQSAAAYHDHFLQTPLDLSFINYLLLCNDLNRIARPLRDRCIVIKLAAPSPAEIAIIAEREIARRGLAPELVLPLVKAVRSGQITSLRKLHKALDAAAAAMARPLLN